MCRSDPHYHQESSHYYAFFRASWAQYPLTHHAGSHHHATFHMRYFCLEAILTLWRTNKARMYVWLIFAGLALFAWVVLVAPPIVAINGPVEGPVVVNAPLSFCILRLHPLQHATLTLRSFWAFPGLLPRPSEDLCYLPRGAHIVSMLRTISEQISVCEIHAVLFGNVPNVLAVESHTCLFLRYQICCGNYCNVCFSSGPSVTQMYVCSSVQSFVCFIFTSNAHDFATMRADLWFELGFLS